MKRSVVMFLLVLLVATSFLFTTQGGRADNIRVTITLDQEELSADVAPGDDCTVTFTGNVTCEIPLECPVERVIFTLGADIEYWSASIVPSQVEFDRNNTRHSFSVTVYVWEGASHYWTNLLTVSGSGEARPSNEHGYLGVDPDTAYVGANQFHMYEVRCEETARSCSAGVSRTYELEIENLGNDQDTIKIELEEGSAEELEDAKIDVKLSQTEYLIDEGSFIFCNVKVETGGDPDKTKTYDIILVCYSTQAQRYGEEYEEVFIILQLTVSPSSSSSPGFEAVVLLFGTLFFACIGRRIRRTG